MHCQIQFQKAILHTMSSSPYAQQSSDQEHGGGGETSEDDGEAIEVDPLTFCQPEMSSGGQGDMEESFEEHESEDEVNEQEHINEHSNSQPNENDSMEDEQREYDAMEDVSNQSSNKIKKVPSVQLTVVNKKKDKSEKVEKENGSIPKVTITAINSLRGTEVPKKEDSPVHINKKRKLDIDFSSFTNGIDSNTSNFPSSSHLSRNEPVLDHPIELRKLLFGDLSQEMCITVSRPGTNWQKTLSPLDFDPDSPEVHRFNFGRNSNVNNGNRMLRLLRQHGDSARSAASHGSGRSNFVRHNTGNSSAISPEPAPIIKEDPPIAAGITQSQLEEAMASGLLTDFFASHSAFGGGSDTANTVTRGGPVTDTNTKPPAKYNRDLIDPDKGIFEDPETGTIRYRCR